MFFPRSKKQSLICFLILYPTIWQDMLTLNFKYVTRLPDPYASIQHVMPHGFYMNKTTHPQICIWMKLCPQSTHAYEWRITLEQAHYQLKMNDTTTWDAITTIRIHSNTEECQQAGVTIISSQ